MPPRNCLHAVGATKIHAVHRFMHGIGKVGIRHPSDWFRVFVPRVHQYTILNLTVCYAVKYTIHSMEFFIKKIGKVSIQTAYSKWVRYKLFLYG